MVLRCFFCADATHDPHGEDGSGTEDNEGSHTQLAMRYKELQYRYAVVESQLRALKDKFDASEEERTRLGQQLHITQRRLEEAQRNLDEANDRWSAENELLKVGSVESHNIFPAQKCRVFTTTRHL